MGGFKSLSIKKFHKNLSSCPLTFNILKIGLNRTHLLCAGKIHIPWVVVSWILKVFYRRSWFAMDVNVKKQKRIMKSTA